MKEEKSSYRYSKKCPNGCSDNEHCSDCDTHIIDLMVKKHNKYLCPLCAGKGTLEKQLDLDIKDLRKKGLTIRQISKAIGKSPTTIHYHLHKN